MLIEVREDSVLVTGYINAVERYSKPIREELHGKIRTFIERIKAGTFRKALKRNDNVLVLLNHDSDRVLANTKDGSALLEEDNIGLRAEITIKDPEVVEKARNNQLSGWSFGFYANSDELGSEGENETRTVTDIDLIEVSILDDSKSPAYYGTSISARSENMNKLEVRSEGIDDEQGEILEGKSLLEELESAIEPVVTALNAIAQKLSELIVNAQTDSNEGEDPERECGDEEEEKKSEEDASYEEPDDDNEESRSLEDYRHRLEELTKA